MTHYGHRIELRPSVVWITGASSGIGRALARLMAEHGHTVVASARRAAMLEQLAAECAGFPGSIHPVPLDVTDGEAVLAASEKIELALGPIDIAVLAAGARGRRSRATGFTASGIRATFDLNLMGTVNVVEAVRDAMAARGRGRIAFVSSMAGYRGVPHSAAYCASKAALIALAEAWRPEFAQCGVTLQVINPGFVRADKARRSSYPTPFVIDPAAAAKAIYAGLSSSRFEICFPTALALLAKAARMMPYSLYFAIAERALAHRTKTRRDRPDRQVLAGRQLTDSDD